MICYIVILEPYQVERSKFRPTAESPPKKCSRDHSTQITPVKYYNKLVGECQDVTVKNRSTQFKPMTKEKAIQVDFSNLDIHIIAKSDLLTKEYTGLDSFCLFQILLRYLSYPCTEQDCQLCRKSKRFLFLSVENQFLLTLFKLKTNQTVSYIARAFSISTGSVSEIFNYWVELMFRKFKIIDTNSSLEQCQNFMPTDFKLDFENVREILDATEFYSQKPSDPLSQKQLWSNYKHHNTVKVQIGCTSTGVISSVSDVYGGLVSDKKLFERSGRNKVLNSGEAFMVDKGYLISDILQGSGISVVRPPFLSSSNGSQFSENERNIGRQIARKRIVIENVNSRIKHYKILSDKISVHVLKYINEIIFICSFLSNLSKPFKHSEGERNDAE